jgi:hypothetical protein
MSDYLNRLHRETGRGHGQIEGFMWGFLVGVVCGLLMSLN